VLSGPFHMFTPLLIYYLAGELLNLPRVMPTFSSKSRRFSLLVVCAHIMCSTEKFFTAPLSAMYIPAFCGVALAVEGWKINRLKKIDASNFLLSHQGVYESKFIILLLTY